MNERGQVQEAACYTYAAAVLGAVNPRAYAANPPDEAQSCG